MRSSTRRRDTGLPPRAAGALIASVNSTAMGRAHEEQHAKARHQAPSRSSGSTHRQREFNDGMGAQRENMKCNDFPVLDNTILYNIHIIFAGHHQLTSKFLLLIVPPISPSGPMGPSILPLEVGSMCGVAP